MTIRRWIRAHKLHVLPCLVLALALVACAPVDPSRWAAAQATTVGQRATDEEAVAGGAFNRFFPAASNGYTVVYTQEKIGFAEAVLKQSGADVATLSVFDTVSNPEAAAKYESSTKKLGDYPVVAVGENGTAILVADRFQVQIRAKSASFSAADRETWLLAFDLNGLARLQ